MPLPRNVLAELQRDMARLGFVELDPLCTARKALTPTLSPRPTAPDLVSSARWCKYFDQRWHCSALHVVQPSTEASAGTARSASR
jgi:hypothetical protein